jgi:hypothetical protein
MDRGQAADVHPPADSLSGDRITVTELLRLDSDDASGLGISDAAGDSFLCAQNPIFRAIREISSSLSLSFSGQETPLRRAYAALPLLCLQEIIESGTVPFIPTREVLVQVAQKSLDLSFPVEFVPSLITHNHLLHESAHCIAFRYLSEEFLPSPRLHPERFVLCCLISEAYANTVERLAASCAFGPLHRMFFRINSYSDTVSDSVYSESIEALGIEEALNLGLMVFFRLNLGYSWDGGAIDRLAQAWQWTGSPPPERSLLLRLFVRHLASLNQTFVANTTPLFFNYAGCGDSYAALLQNPNSADLSREPALLAGIDRLVKRTAEQMGRAGLLSRANRRPLQ